MENEFSLYNLGSSNEVDINWLGEREGDCIFCGVKYAANLFTKKAHAIPELLGNHTLFHYNECDKCNAIFSKLERELAAFIGMKRSLYNIEGKKGVPIFKINEKQKITHSKKFNIPVICLDNRNDKVFIDNENNISSIEATKNSYNNTSVFKVFVKMALSIMPVEKLSQYSILKKFVLQGIDQPYPIVPLSESILDIYRYLMPCCICNIFMIISRFKITSISPKKGVKLSLIEKEICGDEKGIILVIYYGDEILQIFIPNDRVFEDSINSIFMHVISEGELPVMEMTVPLCPPERIDARIKPENFSQDIIDCREQKFIKNEVDFHVFSHGYAIPIEPRFLKPDGKGGICERSLELSLNIIRWNLVLNYGIGFSHCWGKGFSYDYLRLY